MSKICILITGGAGFIGSHLVDALVKNNHRIIVVDNLTHGNLKNITAPRHSFIFHQTDIRDPKLINIFKKYNPQIIFHLAAQTSIPLALKNPQLDASINIDGSLNVFECARKNGAKKIIFTSTGGALYGETKTRPTPETAATKPESPYGIAKLTAEHYLQYINSIHKLQTITLRFSNVYGPRQDSTGEAGVIAIFTALMLKRSIPTINSNGWQTRDFIYIDDVITALIKSIKYSNSGTFNIGTGKETSINNLYQTLAELTNFTTKPYYHPTIRGEINRSVLNIKLAHQKLHWQPRILLNRGLHRTVEYLRKLNH